MPDKENVFRDIEAPDREEALEVVRRRLADPNGMSDRGGRSKFPTCPQSIQTKQQWGGITNRNMANICITSLSIRTGTDFASDEQVEALRKDIDETIVYDGPTKFDYVDDRLIECDLGTRWNVPTDALQVLAAKHHVRIRAVGREDGCAFVQVVCIDDLGKLVQDESISYAF